MGVLLFMNTMIFFSLMSKSPSKNMIITTEKKTRSDHVNLNKRFNGFQMVYIGYFVPPGEKKRAKMTININKSFLMCRVFELISGLKYFLCHNRGFS